ncbi:hypothetical protein SDC9_139604 [bioreactor metagenome]|uniref:Uncharacterized protein n=1 Tax=bioreactor metagenome TaxID=1076179 RepID=A0A645DT61_9ZZZZ
MIGGAIELADDELRRALAVARDGAAEVLGYGGKRCAERVVVRALARDHRVAREAVRQNRDHVVRRGVPVNADHVEAVWHVRAQRFLQHGGGDAHVRRDESQHGRHVRLNHAAALADAADMAGFAANGERKRDLLFRKIGGHDGLGSGVAVVAQCRDERGNAVCDGFDVERFSDDARGRDHDVARRNLQRGTQ